MEKISLFVSSPGDVLPERDAVTRAVNRINDEQRELLQIKDIRWENAYYGAHDTFQSQIIETEACNLVVCVFWRRLGSELPPDFPKRMKDGRPFPSGTVYELMTALEARAEKHSPDVWVYKKTQALAEPIQDPDEMARRLRQWQALEDFWRDFFVSAQGQFTAAYTSFDTADQFEAMFEKNLRAWLSDKGLLKPRPSWSLAEKGSPFRGLEAFDVEHERIMFGREALAERAVEALRRDVVNKNGFLLLIGESGSGKSSLARAGILPRVTRLTGEADGHSDVWRLARVTISAGEDPFGLLAAALFKTEALSELTQSDYTTPAALAEAARAGGAAGEAPIVRTLGRIAEAFRTKQNFERPANVRLVLLIDQLESLFVATAAEQEKFAGFIRALVATGLVAVVATLRSDHYEPYCRVGDLLALKTSGTTIDVPMPGPEGIADIVRGPSKAAGLSWDADGNNGERLDDALIKATAGRDALPLLQFTLEKLYEAMVARLAANGVGLASAGPEDLVLRSEDYATLGGLAGAIRLVAEKAYSDLDSKAQACLPQLLRALLRRGDEGVIAEAAPEADIVKSEPMRRLVNALLASRILVTRARARDGTQETVIGFAHEAVLRGWPAVAKCIEDNRAFYRIRHEVAEAEARWHDGGKRDDRLIPSGQPLAEARSLVRDFRAELPQSLIAYVEASSARDRAMRIGSRRWQAAVAVISIIAAAGLIYAAISQAAYEKAYWHLLADSVSPKVLTTAKERALTAGNAFQECTDCPMMVVVPRGRFRMGASATDASQIDSKEFAENLKDHPGAYADELPVHEVTIASPFAVAKYDVTFAEWDTCYMLGGCAHYPSDETWGRGERPVIHVDWSDAKQYVAWLSKRTGKTYRLLTEAEWEYSARAGSGTAFNWGDQVGTRLADCDGCGSEWDNKETAEVGRFKPNAFSLFDMAGNVWQWVEDCYTDNYQNAPSNGAAVSRADCQQHVLRGGSWYSHPINMRSAMRAIGPQPPNPLANTPARTVGFRVARTLSDTGR
jgi:formylglycine-generating enzyme required for sulfatase activity/energy-coupling factor transporter ATP-binding protein EcfA2